MNKTVVLIARILLGLVFFVFGSNKFIGFIPPFEYPEGSGANAYFGGLAASGFFFVLLGIAETLSGLALLIGRYVPLALLILAPITLNILLFHAVLDPANGLVGYLTFILNWVLFFAYKPAFEGALKAK